MKATFFKRLTKKQNNNSSIIEQCVNSLVEEKKKFLYSLCHSAFFFLLATVRLLHYFHSAFNKTKHLNVILYHRCFNFTHI